jgi:hypothetical protein
MQQSGHQAGMRKSPGCHAKMHGSRNGAGTNANGPRTKGEQMRTEGEQTMTDMRPAHGCYALDTWRETC